MKPALIFLLLAPCAAGCKHSTSSSSTSHTETQTTTESSSSETGNTTTVTTTSEAPGKTTTTVEDYAADPEPVSGGDSSAGDHLDAGLSGGAPDAVANPPRPRRLVRRTVTVTEHGAETTETHQQASTQGTAATETKAAAQADTKAQAQEASAPSAGCIGSSWLIGLGILLFAAALVAGILKFRKAV